jgi:hypothetical protein
MMDGGGFIRELCVALEHRWKPEQRFLLFTAYFDESDTHGKTPPIIMACLLGHARQWELFGRKLRKLQHAENFSIFHGKEIRSGHGQYADWDNVKGSRIISSLTNIVRDELTNGWVIQLPYEKYISDYRNTPNPKGISLDSQYGICFRLIMRTLVNGIYRSGTHHKLHVVVERGHSNAGNTERIFDEMKQTLKARGLELLGDFTLASSKERPELMAADFLAHTYSLMQRPGSIGLAGYAAVTPEPAPNEAGITFLEPGPETFGALKLELQQERWERQRFAREQKSSGSLGETC